MEMLERAVDALMNEKMVGNIAVRVSMGDRVLYDLRRAEGERTITDRTLFDMASVTKIIVTTSLALIAADRGLLSIDDPVSRFFTVPADKRELTVQHLLTHTMGIGHKSLLGANGAYETVQDYILGIPLDSPIGSEVRYSCPGFILLGRIMEKIYGERLDAAFYRHVAAPLGLTHTVFLPDRSLDIVNSNRSDADKGCVNDYNCRSLGGVCGNAGLFSCVEDLTRFVAFLRRRGEPLFSEETFALATKNYTPGMQELRSLGYLYVGADYAQTGGLFREGSIGHCGHTGQSVFVDGESGLSVIILSDATVFTAKKYGKERYSEVVEMRRVLHEAIKEDLNETFSNNGGQL